GGAGGDARGKSWTAPSRDPEGRGARESPPGKRRRAGLGPRGLISLPGRPQRGPAGPDIPAGTRFRITLQWREAHDPLYAQTGEDPYRLPLARNMRLVLLHQPDPTGTRQPADDLEVVAQSVGLPQRLGASPSSASYRITL